MSRPNVIVVLTDQQRFDTIGILGGPSGLTRNLDRLGASGTIFTHAFTCQPVCGPARACLQTGLYATTAGVWRNGLRLDPKHQTLADHFNAAGYFTGYIGKWHLMPESLPGAVPRDGQGRYQFWLGANCLEWVSDAYQTHLYDQDGKEHFLPGYRVDALTDAAIRFVQTNAERPFFLFLSYLEPHHQNSRDDYPAPDGYAEQFEKSELPADLAALGGNARAQWPGYCGMIKRIDEAYGRINDALKSLGLLQNTVVLFTSDHGNHFRTRNSEYKRSCHEASLRIPAIFTGPGFERGGRINRLISLVDFPPTLLAAAGLPVPEEMQGASLLPLVQNPNAAWPDEVFAEISESHVGRVLRTSKWKYSVRSVDTKSDGWYINRGDSDVYIEDALYDLESDPWELANLITDKARADERGQLRRRLLAYLSKTFGVHPEIRSAAKP